MGCAKSALGKKTSVGYTSMDNDGKIRLTIRLGTGEEASPTFLQVEIDSDATAADLKAKIEEEYKVPSRLQLLRRSDRGKPAASIWDGERVANFNEVMFLTVESPVLKKLQAQVTAMVKESAETKQAMMESLKGVRYNLNFVFQPDGQLEKTLHHEFEALTFVGDAMQVVQMELGSAVDRSKTIFFQLRGKYLPPNARFAQCGIENNETLIATTAPPLAAFATAHAKPRTLDTKRSSAHGRDNTQLSHESVD